MYLLAWSEVILYNPLGLMAATKQGQSDQDILPVEDLHKAPGVESREFIAKDVFIVVLLICAVIAIDAHSPTDSYAHSQHRQMAAAIATLHDNWILPRNHQDGLARKPQLYAWLVAPVLKVTNIYEDPVFRWPCAASAIAACVLVYLLGRRWMDRHVGLVSAVLFTTTLHMSRVVYRALTDMLLTSMILLAVFCADRVLFHRVERSRRTRWVVGFWIAVILGALCKGWGLVNIPLLVLIITLWSVTRRRIYRQGFLGNRRLRQALVLGLRRIARAGRDLYLKWGIIATLGVLVPLWGGMLWIGGEEFRQIVYFEVWQRLTGSGPHPPRSTSAPAFLYLIYYAFPMSLLAAGALLTVRPKRWFHWASPTRMPLIWILSILAPFSISHGFRPDYLLPCYPAVAILAGWVVVTLAKPHDILARNERVVRGVAVGAGVAIGAVLIFAPMVYLLHDYMPDAITRQMPYPQACEPHSVLILGMLPLLGLVVVTRVATTGLHWRMPQLCCWCAIGMLGIMFIDTHYFTSHARHGDGETAVAFVRRARDIVGDEPVLVSQVDKIGVELYLGRFGKHVSSRDEILESGRRFLFASDRGLNHMGITPGGKDIDPTLHLRLRSRRIKVDKLGSLNLYEIRTRPHHETDEP